jgi:hypothetical protein
VHMHWRGLLRGWWWPVDPTLVLTRWPSKSPPSSD